MSGRGFNIIPSWRSTSFDLYFLCFFTHLYVLMSLPPLLLLLDFFEYHRHGNLELCVFFCMRRKENKLKMKCACMIYGNVMKAAKGK